MATPLDSKTIRNLSDEQIAISTRRLVQEMHTRGYRLHADPSYKEPSQIKYAKLVRV